MTPKRRRKPTPRTPEPQRLIEGRDYYCGTCTGHRTVPCDYCVDGCEVCRRTGEQKCPQCKGGDMPVSPPLQD